MLVDNCAMQLVMNPGQFDVILTGILLSGPSARTVQWLPLHTSQVDGIMTAVDTLTYNENEIRRIAVKAFDIAMKRRKKVDRLLPAPCISRPDGCWQKGSDLFG